MALPPIALYVHVPFCLSICPYCDFVVYAARRARIARSSSPGDAHGSSSGDAERVDAYLRALIVELELRANELDARFGPPGVSGANGRRPPLGSVYLGGGTPSLLPAAAVEELLDRVRERFGLAPSAEVTLEANPGPRDRGDLRAFRAAGVTRLSLGAQSMEAGELRRLGRRHTAADVLDAVASARRAGIGSVSVDLLYDVPGQTLTSWQRTLTAVLEAGLDHVSAYALTLDDPEVEGLSGPDGDHLPTRRGARAWRERARAEQDDDRAADMYALADDMLAAAGLGWYEISNWARPGHESRHNLVYWRHEPYVALGVGAHAFDGVRIRRWNGAQIGGYLAALLPPAGSPVRLPPGGYEELPDDLLAREATILRLRLADGLAREIADSPRVSPVLDWARREGLVESTADASVRLTRRGRLLGNEVFARLL